jgi:hypothetical protein
MPRGVKIKADQQAYYYPSPTSVMAGFLVSFYNVVDTRFCFLFRSQKFWSTLRLSKTLVIKKYYFTILKSDPIFMQLLPSVQRSGLLWKGTVCKISDRQCWLIFDLNTYLLYT